MPDYMHGQTHISYWEGPFLNIYTSNSLNIFIFIDIKSFFFPVINFAVIQKEIGSVDWTIEDSAVETRPLVDASKSLSNKKTDDGDMPGNNNEVALQNLETGVLESSVKERSLSNGISSVSDSALPDSSELRGIKRSNESEEPNSDKKRSRTIIIGSDEADVVKDECSTKLEDHSVSPENINDAATDNSLHSQSLSEKFYCTACNNVAIEVHPHPILNVIVCKDCKCLLEKKMHVKV